MAEEFDGVITQPVFEKISQNVQIVSGRECAGKRIELTEQFRPIRAQV